MPALGRNAVLAGFHCLPISVSRTLFKFVVSEEINILKKAAAAERAGREANFYLVGVTAPFLRAPSIGAIEVPTGSAAVGTAFPNSSVIFPGCVLVLSLGSDIWVDAFRCELEIL